MGTPLFIALTLVAIVLIAWAIDIPTTKWEGFKPIPKKRLLDILKQIHTQDEEEARVETTTPAATYAEAFKRMQRREEARTKRRTSQRDTSKIRRR